MTRKQKRIMEDIASEMKHQCARYIGEPFNDQQMQLFRNVTEQCLKDVKEMFPNVRYDVEIDSEDSNKLTVTLTMNS